MSDILYYTTNPVKIQLSEDEMNGENEMEKEKEVNIVLVPILQEGTLKHEVYGEMKITKDKLLRMKANFDNKVRGIDLVVDENHDPNHKSRGVFKELFFKNDINGMMQLWGQIELNPLGKELMGNQEYLYFSPEFIDEWINTRGEKYTDVLLGGALTNRPFQKDLPQVMVFSEDNQILNNNTMPNNNSDDPTKELDQEVETEKVETIETVTEEVVETDATEVEDPKKENLEVKTEQKELSEVVDENSLKLSELPSNVRVFAERILAENKELKQKERVREFSEKAEAFIFSEDKNPKGNFLETAKKDLVSFLSSLSDSQVKSFNELMKKTVNPSVQFGEIGISESPDTENENESANVRVAKVEAKLFKEVGSLDKVRQIMNEKYPKLMSEYQKEELSKNNFIS